MVLSLLGDTAKNSDIAELKEFPQKCVSSISDYWRSPNNSHGVLPKSGISPLARG
ncbi:hypothetical protein [Calothrix sp. 336/3]|uniref:hypothetical protein n=1 Tax=Calothrix sp. 336/3 TaxID=1337936 RepID=UPI000A8AB92A|nr:hypothetical protein [Calothrix sp. 336/3]